MSICAVSTLLMVLVSVIEPSGAAEQARKDEVRQRSADVMPFDMGATTHIFTKTPAGGAQRVVVKKPEHAQQIEHVRAHLSEIADGFRRRDFSGPLHVHGAAMPGLATLQSAAADAVKVSYRAIELGGEIEYTSADATLVDAIHRWFDAQVADHGADAMAGHDHSMQLWR